MLRTRVLILTGIFALLVACEDDDSTGIELDTFVATLTGAAERPTPVTTNATGTARFIVNTNRTITYDLAVTGMTPTVQHIHGPADDNTAAGIIVNLTIGTNQTLTPASFTGAVSYDSLLVLLNNNRAYVNVHSAAFQAGEIRGNLRKQ